MSDPGPLPPLTADWHDTQTGLHLRTQILGKTRLALAPMQNHWWQTTLYVTARGLTTSVMPYGDRHLEVDVDFIDHAVVFRTDDGATRSLPLQAQSMAEFYGDYMDTLRSLGMPVKIWRRPCELAVCINFDQDHRSFPYDRDAVEQFFAALQWVDAVLKKFRGRFIGKCSPTHLWWGSFDMACTRFSGRRAPTHPGGIPNLADYVTREAYSHECISAGWWPGTPGGPIEEAGFYAYAYPEPTGLSVAPVRPSAARYDTTLREFILPHSAVVAATDGEGCVLDFLQNTYDTAARLAAWSAELTR